MSGEQAQRYTRGDWLKQLRSFCHVAHLKSISRAAERVSLGQPAVSRQVRMLEEKLAVALLDRRGPRIFLTSAGEQLYHFARPLVEGLDRLPDTFTEQYRGVASHDLHLAASQSTAAHMLPRFLKRFRERHPEIRINVRIDDGRERMRWLRAYEVDVVVAAVDVPPPDIGFRPIFSSESVFITPEDHPLAGRESVEFAEAVAYPMVTHPASHYIAQTSDIILRLHGHIANTILEVEGWNAIKLYVEAGVGISIVPDIHVHEEDRVWSIPASRYFPSRVYGVLTRRDEIFSLAASWFIQIVDELSSEHS